MPSEFDQLDAEILAPACMDQFGVRDAHGELRPLQYKITEGEPLLFTGISTDVRSVPQPAAEGFGFIRVDTKTWQIPREQLDAKGVRYPHRKAKINDHDSLDPFDWQINETETVWGPTFVTLALQRSPRTAGNEIRRGTV